MRDIGKRVEGRGVNPRIAHFLASFRVARARTGDRGRRTGGKKWGSGKLDRGRRRMAAARPVRNWLGRGGVGGEGGERCLSRMKLARVGRWTFRRA